MAEAKRLGAPYELVVEVAETGKLPVPNFAAGGIATPADAALCMTLGAEAVFVGSGIFKSDDPAKRARAIVKATTHWRDAEALRRGRGVARRRDEGHRGGEPRRGGAAPDARMVDADRSRSRPESRVLALQGDFEAHRRRLAELGRRRASRRSGREDLARATGSSCRAASRRRSGSSSRWSRGRRRSRAFARARPADPRHLRRGDPPGARGRRIPPRRASA